MLTLEEILKLESMQSANARVLAAHQYLDHQVTWVHISEMEYLAHVLKGGELLLTQGRGIPRHASGQRKWVRELAKLHIAGVAIEVGHVLDEIPNAIVREAEIEALPLIRLSRPAYFMEVTRQVHSIIANSQHDALLHADRLGTRLAQLVMAGGSLQEALDEVSSALGFPVALTGPTDFLQVYAPRNEMELDSIRSWRAHSRNTHTIKDGSTCAIAEDDSARCLYHPIVFQGEMWGCLHVLIGDEPPSDMAQRMLTQAAMSIGLSYAVRQSSDSLGGDIRSRILKSLLSGVSPQLQDALEQAELFGLEVEGELRVLIAEPVSVTVAAGTMSHERKSFEARTALAQEISQFCHEGSIVGHVEGYVTAILADGAQVVEMERAVAEGRLMTLMALSGPVTSRGLAKAWREVLETLNYAREQGGGRGIYFADRLFIERVLLKMNSDGALSDLIELELGPILDADQREDAPLLTTLETYFQVGGNKSSMARRLAVDRRTVHFRLQRIGELIGSGFLHPDKQLALHLATRGYRLLSTGR